MALKTIGAFIAVLLFFIFGLIWIDKTTKPEDQKVIEFFADKPYQEISATYEGGFSFTFHGETSCYLRFRDEKGRLMSCECPSGLYLYFNTPEHEKGEKITLKYYVNAYEGFWSKKIYQFRFEDYVLWNAEVY